MNTAAMKAGIGLGGSAADRRPDGVGVLQKACDDGADLSMSMQSSYCACSGWSCFASEVGASWLMRSTCTGVSQGTGEKLPEGADWAPHGENALIGF